MPGFYERLQKNLPSQQQVGAALCRHTLMDSDGHWFRLSELHRSTAGIIENWQEKIAVAQYVLTPAMVVRRSVYEQMGGFLPELCYVLDWEMWQRIATKFSLWFEPALLASYRVHASSATSKLIASAADVRDVRRMIELTAPGYPRLLAANWIERAGRFYAGVADVQNRQLLLEGHWKAAWRRYREVFQLSPGWTTFNAGLSLLNLNCVSSDRAVSAA
jgi:hypothetical protein